MDRSHESATATATAAAHAARGADLMPEKAPLSQGAETHAVIPSIGRDDADEPYIVQIAVDSRPAYSALTESQRRNLLIVASLAATISPASTTTYYPAVTSMARDLNVSITLINLTISTYQVSSGMCLDSLLCPHAIH